MVVSPFCRILRTALDSVILRQNRDGRPRGAPRPGSPSRLAMRLMRKRADIILVELGHFPSRARAQAAIEAGLVSVDGVALRKPSEGIAPGALIEARAPH